MSAPAESKSVTSVHYSKFLDTYEEMKRLPLGDQRSVDFQAARLETLLNVNDMIDFSALKPDIQEKNRYMNVLPSEKFRVKLPKTCPTDYINASLLERERGIKYIISQAPPPSAFSDFWEMIWANGVRAILMLTKLFEGNRLKADTYWNTGLYGTVRVEVKGTSYRGTADSMVIRKLLLTQGKNSREVEHIQLVSWPDHGVPSEMDHFTELVEYWQNLRAIITQQCVARGETPPPEVVHCSAGVGRTGTFVVCDIILSMLMDPKTPDAEKNIDIVQTILEVRKVRPCSVQSADQFKFCYDFIAHVLRRRLLGLDKVLQAKA